MRKIKRYGWLPDLPDQRDFLFAAPPISLPPKMDLRSGCPPVYDQGQLGSCTANAIGGALEFDQMKQGKKSPFTPSRLFIYYNERKIEGTVESDSGAMIRRGQVGEQVGAPETDWPYDIEKFRDRLPKKAFDDAKKNQAVLYQRLTQAESQLKAAWPRVPVRVRSWSTRASSPQGGEVRRRPCRAPMRPSSAARGAAVGYDETSSGSWSATPGARPRRATSPSPIPTCRRPRLSDFWTIRSVE
jgi:hypothetical protein